MLLFQRMELVKVSTDALLANIPVAKRVAELSERVTFIRVASDASHAIPPPMDAELWVISTFSKRMLEHDVTSDEVKEIQKVRQTMLEALSTYQHHDAIAGTAKQQVANDYVFRMLRAMRSSSSIYNKLLKNTIKR